jgi:hypothetical protein
MKLRSVVRVFVLACVLVSAVAVTQAGASSPTVEQPTESSAAGEASGNREALAGQGETKAPAVPAPGTSLRDPTARGLTSGVKTVRELTGLRTETSDTYLQSDGSRSLTIAAHPINYKVAGKWQPIDDTLRESGGRWSPAASPVPVSFPHALGEGPVTIGAAGRQLSFALEGASAPGQAAGSQGTYRGAMAGVDVSYAASAQSVRETLTLDSASVPTVYRYALSLSAGMHAALGAAGTVVVRDSKGNTIYTLAAPTAADSKSRTSPAPVHYELSADGSVLSLVVDAKWLNNPARAFPVKIDPDVYFGAVKDCSLSSGIPTTSLCGERLYVGYSEELKSIGRALLQFNVSSVPKGSQIISSSLAMWLQATSSASPIQIDAYGIEKHEFTSAATWNSYDGTHNWTTAGGDHLKTLAGTTNVKPEWTGGWVSWGFSPQATQWVRDPSSNYGILLKAHNETVNGYDTFYQTEPGEPAPEPNLHIIYEPQMGDPPNEAMFQEPLGNNSTLGVNVANGNLHLTAPDVNYATEGYDTQVARSYNSYDDELVGAALGGGWRLSMGEDQLLYPAWWDGSNAFHEPDGSYTRFDRASWADNHPSAGDKAYTGDAYRPETLITHESGSRTLTYNDTGIEWQFDNSENGFPQKIVDPRGEKNTITMSYTASRLTKVTDTHGHELTLTREAGEPHRLTKIKGAGAEEWKYTYSSGLLSEVKGPSGLEAKYTYSGPYALLQSITDPGGITVVSYDENARVTSLRHVVNGTISTVGTEDEITTFTYGVEETTVTPPSGESEDYNYDHFGNYIEDPAAQEAASEFYAEYAEIEAGAAKAAIDLQDHSTILASQLSQQLGAEFTNEWFTSGPKIMIGLTSAAYEQTALQDLANLGLADNAEIVVSGTSRAGLEEAKTQLAEKLSSLINGGELQLGLRTEEDALQVTEASSLTTGQRKEIEEDITAVGVPAHVVESHVAPLGFIAFKCSAGHCDRPLRGGVSIESNSAGCSAGYLAQSLFSKKLYVFTAGHCLWEEGVGHTWKAETSAGVEKAIGKGRAYVYGEHQSLPGGENPNAQGDAAIIEVEKGYWLPTPESKERLEGFPSIIQYKGAEAPRRELYRVFGEATTRPGTEAAPGQVVCVDGVGEGSPQDQCGIVESYGLSTNLYNEERETVEGHTVVKHKFEAHVERIAEINMCVKGKGRNLLKEGTSGGPVIKDHRAVGLNEGSEIPEPGGVSCKESFTPIWVAEEYLNAQILTDFSGY